MVNFTYIHHLPFFLYKTSNKSTNFRSSTLAIREKESSGSPTVIIPLTEGSCRRFDPSLISPLHWTSLRKKVNERTSSKNNLYSVRRGSQSQMEILQIPISTSNVVTFYFSFMVRVQEESFNLFPSTTFLLRVFLLLFTHVLFTVRVTKDLSFVETS